MAPTEAPSITFDQAAAAYVKTNAAGWRNSKHTAQWTSTLKTYASPIFGSRSVADIDRPAVLKVIEPIWATKSETASRLRGRIEAILDWAAVMGYRSGDNPARWKGHLDKVLPAQNKVKKVTHHKALPYEEVPAFMVTLRDQLGIAAQALQFTILTAGRTTEILESRWSEIDIAKKVWTVPAARMKADRIHRVPLTAAAIAALPPQGNAGEADLIFAHSSTGRSLSENAMTAVLKRMGVDATVHGFRSSFRDWAAEKTDHGGDAAELALAHAVGGKVRTAYQRGDLLEKRRLLMKDWANYILKAQSTLSRGAR